MAIATKCTCGYSITGVCTSSVKECRQLRKENTQLPKEVADQIFQQGQDMLAFAPDNKWSYIKGATAYATKLQYSEERNSILLDEMSNLSKLLQEKDDKLHQANEVIKVLEYDNNKLKGEVEGLKGMIMRHAIAFANWLLPSGCIANEKDYELFLMKPEAVLDESAAGREEAVEFAEWLAGERWQPRINTEWARYETIYSDVSVKTTAQLYELFKQQNTKA